MEYTGNYFLERNRIRTIYRCLGDQLSTKAKDMTQFEIIRVMQQVIQLMTVLEKDGIVLYSLRHENIFVNEDTVRILYTGPKIKVEEVLEMFNATHLPPEALHKDKAIPSKVDVYSWGISLYQLLTNKTVIKSDYETLSKEIEVKDENLKKWVVKVLTEVLDADPKKRPEFRTLLKTCELLKPALEEEKTISVNKSNLEFSLKGEVEELKSLLDSAQKEIGKITFSISSFEEGL